MNPALEDPFALGDLDFLMWMRRGEFQFVFSLACALQHQGELNPRLPPDEAYRAIMAMLREETGWEPAGLHIDDDLLLRRTVEAPIEPGASNWVAMLQAGQLPDLEVHLPEAVQYADARPELMNFVSPLADFQMHIEREVEMAKSLGQQERDEWKADGTLWDKVAGFLGIDRETVH